MGTNYYYKDLTGKEYHIGKSSYGWEFSFQAQPDLDIYTYDHWYSFLEDKERERFYLEDDNYCIFDEYGDTYSYVSLFRDIISTEVRRVIYSAGKDDERILLNHHDYCIKNGHHTGTYKDVRGYSFDLTDFS